MRANSEETLRRGSILREKHGSWVKVAKESRPDIHKSLDSGRSTEVKKASPRKGKEGV